MKIGSSKLLYSDCGCVSRLVELRNFLHQITGIAPMDLDMSSHGPEAMEGMSNDTEEVYLERWLPDLDAQNPERVRG